MLARTILTVSLIALCFVGRSIFGVLYGLVSFRVSQRLAQEMRTELLVQMTSLSADWHERTMLGEKLSRMEQDVEQVSQYGADVGNTLFLAVLSFLVNLVIMAVLSWRMTIVVLPLLPVFSWVSFAFSSQDSVTSSRRAREVGKRSR